MTWSGNKNRVDYVTVGQLKQHHQLIEEINGILSPLLTPPGMLALNIFSLPSSSPSEWGEWEVKDWRLGLINNYGKIFARPHPPAVKFVLRDSLKGGNPGHLCRSESILTRMRRILWLVLSSIAKAVVEVVGVVMFGDGNVDWGISQFEWENIVRCPPPVRPLLSLHAGGISLPEDFPFNGGPSQPVSRSREDYSMILLTYFPFSLSVIPVLVCSSYLSRTFHQQEKKSNP